MHLQRRKRVEETRGEAHRPVVPARPMIMKTMRKEMLGARGGASNSCKVVVGGSMNM